MSVASSHARLQIGGAKMAADVEYYRYRMAEELFAADTSPSAAAEQCHRKLAEAYAKKLEALNAEQPLPGIQLAA